MSVKGGFFNAEVVAGVYDREYSAEDFAKCFSGFISDGIVGKSKSSSTSLKAIKGSEESNIITVYPGYAWINGKWVENDDTIDFEISLPTTTGTERYDLICLRCDYDQRTFSVIKKEGEEWSGSVPSIPEYVDNKHMKEIPLAYIHANSYTLTIQDVIVTDARIMAELKINASNMNGLIFIKCAQEEYDEMKEHDPDAVYFVYDEKGKVKQYMGDVEIGGTSVTTGSILPNLKNNMSIITGTIMEG